MYATIGFVERGVEIKTMAALHFVSREGDSYQESGQR